MHWLKTVNNSILLRFSEKKKKKKKKKKTLKRYTFHSKTLVLITTYTGTLKVKFFFNLKYAKHNSNSFLFHMNPCIEQFLGLKTYIPVSQLPSFNL